jgi:hypothetical protein
MTPHHMKVIVQKIEATDDYTLQLTALADDTIEFAVWRHLYDEDVCESEAFAAPDGDASDEDAGEGEIDDEPEILEEVSVNVPEGSFFFEGRIGQIQQTQTTAENVIGLPRFLYRHIRKVKMWLEDDQYCVSCSCEECAARFSACVHIFLAINYVAPDMALSEYAWHPRNTKIHYRNALFQDETCCLNDLLHTVVSGVTTPRIPSRYVQKWMEKNTDTPSTDGIPKSGRLNSEFEPSENVDDGGGDAPDALPPQRPITKNRKAAPDKVAADQFHWQITECLGKQHAVYKEYCDTLKNFRDDLQRRGIEHSGAGKRNRTRAYWERGTTNKIDKVAQTQVAPVLKVARPSRVPETAPSNLPFEDGLNEDRARGLSGKNAWHYLEQIGPTVNDILEIWPDLKAQRAGQRWFMIVKKAKKITVQGKECIESCRWCKTNTLEPCNTYKEVTLCRIENVKAYGVREAPIFANVRSIAPVIPTPTPTKPQITVESSSSDSDSPISSGAKKLAREMAAAKKSKVSQKQVLAAVQRMSERTKPQVSEECAGDAYCLCSKCAGY